MTISLENEHLRLTFAKKGAELQHITGVDSGTEYLWNGDLNYWGKFSPVLFPIIGALKNNQYKFQDKNYDLPRHGFARDMEFEYKQLSTNEIVFTLHSTDEILHYYPFKFKLCLRYQLIKTEIYCTYEVTNVDHSDMFFSIGGHPAFAAPLNEQGIYNDYYLYFNRDEEITYHHIVDNLIAEETSTIQLNEGKLFLKHALFYKDALVFKNLKSDCITLMNTKNYNGLDFHFKGFPYFGIWAAKDANFICLEPWCGIADGIKHNQQLKDKEGIIKLAANTQWKRKWSVTFF